MIVSVSLRIARCMSKRQAKRTRSLPKRGRPFRPGSAGIASSGDSKAIGSCRIAPATVLARASLLTSTMKCRLLPRLHRSSAVGARPGAGHAGSFAPLRCRKAMLLPQANPCGKSSWGIPVKRTHSTPVDEVRCLTVHRRPRWGAVGIFAVTSELSFPVEPGEIANST